MRAVFFGTPAIAVPALRALNSVAEIVGVVCQPDRPAGRGLHLQPPAVKTAALELGLDVHQPLKVKTGLDLWLRERSADIGVVMAYGRILPISVLEAPRAGCVNLHASLLPRWRGAAPINWAIAHGDGESGITLMQMDAGLDTGPLLSKHALAIGPEETAGELAERLALLAAEVVSQDVPRAARGELVKQTQDDAHATHARPLERADGELDFTRRASELANWVRALSPRPGAHTALRGKSLKVTRARALTEPARGAPGSLVFLSGRALVNTGEGLLEILRAQLEGRKELAVSELINGRALLPSDVLGKP